MPPQPSLVVWLHGLGDTGMGWMDMREEGAERLPGTRWLFPNAPHAPVTCNDGESCTSWFDIQRIPVSLSEPEDPKGLDESVAAVHQVIKGSGVAPSRVVVGGFSQGGLLAAYAAATYPESLAGAVSLSGWAPRRSRLGELVSAANRSLPMLFCWGSVDGVVLPQAAKAGADAYAQFNRNVSTYVVPGMGHSCTPDELGRVWKFLGERLAGD
eukprot:TRINITY_DN24418_c0_g1_i1.p2 TRINITY_DN24418_c0_g1~~TRINITY_DN24418_c0_g1_i1.p2  ORF type:complete len:237 (+),score=77.39 TRINITY_DN24418_c0_g1_i1:78-713(+)